MDKHSRLLQKFVNHGQKKFYNIGPGPSVSELQPRLIKKKSFGQSRKWLLGIFGNFLAIFPPKSDDLKLPKMSKKFPKSSSKLGTLYDEFLLTYQYEKSSSGQCYKTFYTGNLQIFVIS